MASLRDATRNLHPGRTNPLPAFTEASYKTGLTEASYKPANGVTILSLARFLYRPL